MRRRARTIVLGASHWHAPLYADRIAQAHDVQAFCDPDPALESRFAGLWDAPFYTSWSDLVDAHGDAELAYVFVPHDEMREVCLELVERGIPLVVEKPLGTSLADLVTVREAAATAGVPVTVSLVQRDGPVDRWLAKAGRSTYESVQFVAGPPERYRTNGNPWMLDAGRAGGGCMVNLAPHFVDLFLQSAGGAEVVVTAALSTMLHGGEVEDYASMRIVTGAGQIATLEMGYAFPDSGLKRYCNYLRIGPRGAAAIGTDGHATFTGTDGSTETARFDVDSDPLYGVFVERVAATLDRGFEGMPRVADLEAAMAVIWEAYDYGRDKGNHAYIQY